MSVRRYVYEVLNEEVAGGRKSAVFKYFMIGVILANIIAVMAGTVPELRENDHWLVYVSYVAFLVFAAEYVLRVWTCRENPKYGSRNSVSGRLRYIVSPLAIIDLFVLVPYIAPPLVIQDLERLRALRLFQLFVLLKMIRYSTAIQTFASVFNKKKRELGMILYLVLFILIISSTLMYFAEHGAQPEKFSSIPATMWWGVETLTTVGYGDTVPITLAGKVLGGIVMLLGIGLFALPAGILASGFYEEFSQKKIPPHETRITCPHCGKEFGHTGARDRGTQRKP